MRFVVHCFEGKKYQASLFAEAKALNFDPEILHQGKNEFSVVINKLPYQENQTRINPFLQSLLNNPTRYAVFYPNESKLSNPNLLQTHTRLSPLSSQPFTPNTLNLTPNLAPNTYTAPQLISIYNFPPPKSSTSTLSVGIISFGGSFQMSDVKNYWTNICGYTTYPKVTTVSIDGASYVFGQNVSADEENTLDIEIVGGVSPMISNIVWYSAPNTATGFYDALNAAFFDSHQNAVVSISWGGAESLFGSYTMNAIAQLFAAAAQKGINVTVASGDGGSSDRYGSITQSLNVDFPSSCPNVIACGATSLLTSPTTQEVAWSWNPLYQWGTGGGVSTNFPAPSYQSNLIPNGFTSPVPFRVLPDISTVGDPLTPIVILINNQIIYMGGTSVVAPTIAGLLLRINPQTFINPTLYSHRNNNVQTPSSWFRNITVGRNPYYSCGVNSFSCVCGIGSVNGTNLGALFTNSSSSSALLQTTLSSQNARLEEEKTETVKTETVTTVLQSTMEQKLEKKQDTVAEKESKSHKHHKSVVIQQNSAQPNVFKSESVSCQNIEKSTEATLKQEKQEKTPPLTQTAFESSESSEKEIGFIQEKEKIVSFQALKSKMFEVCSTSCSMCSSFL